MILPRLLPGSCFLVPLPVISSSTTPGIRMARQTHCPDSTTRRKKKTREPAYILPQAARLGAVQLGIEQEVLAAQANDPSPSTCPPGRLFVPASIRARVLQWCHTSRFSCHPGVARTCYVVQRRFWWPTLRDDVREFVNACQDRAKNKTSFSKPSGLLHLLPIPSRPWTHIALDFFTGLPPSKGKTTILTVADLFSKMVHFIPLPKLPSAKETAQLLLQHVFRLHSLPRDMVSDREPQFIANFWAEYC